MSWEPEIEELNRRIALARQMGGEERVTRQRAAGRLTIRERIERLLDEGSFTEIGSISGSATYDAEGRIAGFTPANSIFGRGSLDGRPVVVTGDDFTVRGGSADAAIHEKNKMAETMAAEFRLPIIRLLEGSGGGGSVRTIEKNGRTFLPGGVGGSAGIHLGVSNMGEVPVVALALGSVAGLAAMRLSASHFSIMVKNLSFVFVAGPPVVQQLGEACTKEDLGGYKVQLAAGAVDYAAESEEDAFAVARRFLSYLPSSVWDVPSREKNDDDIERCEEMLISVVPRDKRQAYQMRRVIEAVVDTDNFFEMGREYGRPIITGLARLDGWPVAVMAADPLHGAGAWNGAACQKIIRFIDFAETFHLPIVHLADCPGFQVGHAAEAGGAIRLGMRAISAINQSTVPWCTILVRNIFGVGGGSHQPQRRLALRYAWPSARWGGLPLEGGIEAAYKAEIEASPDPKAKIAEIHAKLDMLHSPFRTAETFWVEEIIDPRETRPLLCEFANLAAPLRKPGRAQFTMRP